MQKIGTTISSTSLIIELLKQDLKVFRFREGLGELGFFSEDHYSNLTHLVYGLMGIGEEQFAEADECYNVLIHSFSLKHMADAVYLDLACMSIYEHLCERFGEEGTSSSCIPSSICN